MTVDVEEEQVSEETAEASLDSYTDNPGIVEAIELYEASVRYYTAATTHYSQPMTVSSSSLADAL